MFGGLKRDWQLVPRPFAFHNYVHKKRLGLKFKKKLDFLRVFKKSSFKISYLQTSFFNAFKAIFWVIFQNYIEILN